MFSKYTQLKTEKMSQATANEEGRKVFVLYNPRREAGSDDARRKPASYYVEEIRALLSLQYRDWGGNTKDCLGLSLGIKFTQDKRRYTKKLFKNWTQSILATQNILQVSIAALDSFKAKVILTGI